MAFKDLLTRRKLLKENESLRAENRHLSIELRNARADLARKLNAYESSDPETIVFECVGVENANDYKVV